MEITYTTTLDDYVAFNRHVFRKSTVGRALFLFTWLLVPAITVAAAVILVVLEGLWPSALLIAAVGLLFAIIYPPVHWVLFDGIIRLYANGLGTRGMLGRTTLILTSESLVEITEATRSETRWPNIKGVEEAGDHTYIFVTGLSAAILPRYGCESGDEYEAARAFAFAQVAHRAEPKTDGGKGKILP